MIDILVMKGLKILLLMLLVTVIKAQQYASVSEDGLEDTGKKYLNVDKLMSETFLVLPWLLSKLHAFTLFSST